MEGIEGWNMVAESGCGSAGSGYRFVELYDALRRLRVDRVMLVGGALLVGCLGGLKCTLQSWCVCVVALVWAKSVGVLAVGRVSLFERVL